MIVNAVQSGAACVRSPSPASTGDFGLLRGKLADFLGGLLALEDPLLAQSAPDQRCLQAPLPQIGPALIAFVGSLVCVQMIKLLRRSKQQPRRRTSGKGGPGQLLRLSSRTGVKYKLDMQNEPLTFLRLITRLFDLRAHRKAGPPTPRNVRTCQVCG